MNILRQDDKKKGQFVAMEGEKQAGLMTYTWAGEDKFIIDHTEVNPEFKGQGVGEKLVMSAVSFARENNLKIMPLCPFAASVFAKNKDLQDLTF